MDKLSLTALLDEDREMVLSNLAGDRSLPAAQATLEKAIDRVMFRYVEGCEDAAQREGAQHILQAMKNTLPVIDAVGEARIWKKQAEGSRRRGLNLSPLALVALAAGLVLVMASVLGVLIGGRLSGALAFVKALLPAALGSGCLFWAGIQSAKPAKKNAGPEGEAVRTEYLVDAEKAWHCLRGAMVQADGQLERIREESALRAQKASERAVPGGRFEPKELDLFGELLESAYASGDENAKESAAAIRFYLHNGGVDVVDYGEGREKWFEFLPASKAGTIRPALISEGKLVKKGLASTKR